MFSLDILSFLSPYNGKVEILPIIFFSIISLLFLVSLISLIINANDKNWENNWENKNLDIEQGTISELSEAISTKSEKVATSMPSIILVIGLLGTFIGLGLALDKASTILSSADMNNVDSSMAQLMGMMEGLGTKFKTSTWGLIAFILLKALSSQNNFEEKRLFWVSNKIKLVLDKRNQKLQEKNENDLNKLILSIEALSKNLYEKHKGSDELRSEIFSNMKRESLDSIIDKLILVSEVGKEQIKSISTSLNGMKQEYQELHKKMLYSLESSFNRILEKQDNINSQNSALLTRLSSEQLDIFNQQHLEITEITHKMSNSLAETFIQAISSLQDQQAQHSDANQNSLKEFAQKICDSIELQQSKIIEAVDKNSHYLDVTAKESQQTRQAMDKFVDESLTTIDHLKQSASGMSQAAKDMGGSASKLQTVIDSLSKEMTSLLAKMKQDLGETIQNMDQSFVSNMNKMTTDLTSTIADMNHNFKNNMSEMAKNLGIATNDISNAVNELSSSVNKTMADVTKAIDESLNVQKEIQLDSQVTSKNLNIHIIEMTQLIEKLSEDITSGLDAISDSNRHVISLNKRYSTSSEKIEALIKVVESSQNYGTELKNLVIEINNNLESNGSLVANVSNIKHYCHELIELLNKNLESLKSEHNKQSKDQDIS